MSGLRSRYAPVRSGVVGGYVSVDGEQKQVEYSGLGYLCTFVGGCLLFVLGVLGAIAFGFVMRNNSNLHELQKQVAELEMATSAPPAPVSDTSAFDALQSQLSDTQEGVSAVHSLYNSLVQQFGTLRENVFALRNGRGNDDDDSSSDDSSSDDFLGVAEVQCLDDSDCTVSAPCRQGECVPSGNGGRCVLSFSGQGTPCTVGSRTGTCGSGGQCIRGQGCVDAEAFEGWYTAQPTYTFWSYAPLGPTEIPTAYHITTQSCNATNFVLQMEFVYGTPKRSREATANDNGRPAPLLLEGGQQLAVVRESITNGFGVYRETFLTLVDPGLVDELGGATLAAFNEFPVPAADARFGLTYLYPISPVTNIRDPDQTTPPLLDNPMVQVEQFVDYMTEILPFTSSMIPEGGVTSQELHQIAQSLKGGPLGPFTAPATDVFKTRLFPDGRVVPVTLIYTQKHIPANPASRITLSGFTGNDEWATLNGQTIRVSPYRFFHETEDVAFTDAFYSEDSRRQNILLDVDTRTFPVYNASIHGVPTLSYSVPRLSMSTEYSELLDILHYLKYRVSPLGDTHAYLEAVGNFVTSLDAFNIPETYADAQAFIDANGLGYSRTDSRSGRLDGPLLYRRAIYTEGLLLNQPFEELGAFVGTTIPSTYDTTLFNYLEPSSVVWLWQRAVPNSPVTTRLHERIGEYGNLFPFENSYVAVTSASGLLNPGAPEGASEYEGFLGGPYTAGDGINPVTNSPDLKDEFGNFLFVSPATAGFGRNFPLETVSGVVRTDILGGRKFGYIRLTEMAFADPLSTALFLDTPHGDGFRFVWARLIKYFNEYQEGNEPPGVDGIIIDISLNFGGIPPNGLVECLGGDRFLADSIEGNGDQLNDNDEPHAFKVPYSGIQNVSGIGVTPEQPSDLRLRLHPSEIEAKIPGGTFKNGTVVVVTSTNAVSAADLFQRTLLGENGDGNLGSTVPGQNVKAHFVGNMHALLLGANPISQRYSPGVSDQSARLQLSNGDGAQPWRYAPEDTFAYQFNTTSTLSRLDSSGQPASGLRPVNSNIRSALYNTSRNVDTGVNGIHTRALSSELFDTVYFDFGYTGPGESFNGYKFADGHWDSSANAGPTGFQRVTQAGGVVFPDQPVADPNQASTWRNSWLEEALRVAQLYTYGNLIQDSGTPLPLAATTSSHNEAVSMLNDLTERVPHTVEIFEETAKEMGYEWEAIQQDPWSYESVMRDLLKRVHYKLYVLHQ